MKPHHIIFIATLGMIASVGWAIAIGEPVDGHGIDHPRFETMNAGGPGLERHTGVIGPAWMFAAFHVLFCMSVLGVGLTKHVKMGALKFVLMGGGAIFLAVFFGLFYSYRNYMYGVEQEFFLGLPVPTAWMLFGVWLFPISFIVLYIAIFRRFYLTQAEIDYFGKIVAWRRAQNAKAEATETGQP